VNTRHADLHRAILLSAVSVVWSGVAGGIAVVLALSTGSLALLGFGFDAAVDSVASIALLWRFRAERDQPDRADRVERIAAVVIGLVLLALGLYLGYQSVSALVGQSMHDTSVPAILLLIASAVVLPPLGLAKRRVADRLSSRALRGDSVLTLVAGLLGVVGIVSALLAAVGVTWADAAGGLVAAIVLLREGVGSLREGGAGTATQ
jgi:divalent metal cation (Fe/Co/Zn/Cd) transporter